MKRKILLYAQAPGSANALAALARPMEEKGYRVALYGKDAARAQYSRYRLRGTDLMENISRISIDELEKFLKKIGPICAITGTNIEDFSERYLWKAAERLNIPTFAILDQWINYGIRFSDCLASQAEGHDNEKSRAYLPSKIFVMDEDARNDAISDGIDASKVVVVGHPYFETVMKHIGRDGSVSGRRIRAKLGVGENDFLLTYASEPLSKTYSAAKDYWGYTEVTIFKELLAALTSAVSRGRAADRKICVNIKLHPRENGDAYKKSLLQFKHTAIPIFIDERSDPWDLIASSDLVCGMSSMFLIESVIMGVPTLSVQIGLKQKNPFLLDRKGVLKSILESRGLMRQIKEALVRDKPRRLPRFDFIKNPSARIITYMERYLCQN